MATLRRDPLISEKTYHVFNRSIAGYVIFNNEQEYERMLQAIRYYQASAHEDSLSYFIKMRRFDSIHHENKGNVNRSAEKLVDLVAFCLMPTHVHFVVKQIKKDGISIFLSNIQNSYARFFNLKHQRKGPLWEGRFKSVLVEDDDQLLHLTRYVHLNPTTANLVSRPEDWRASSYLQYLQRHVSDLPECHYRDVLDMDAGDYKKFVDDRISYQKEIARYKHLFFD